MKCIHATVLSPAVVACADRQKKCSLGVCRTCPVNTSKGSWPPPVDHRMNSAKWKILSLPISWPGMVEQRRDACDGCVRHDPDAEYKPGCMGMKDCGCAYEKTIVNQHKVVTINGKEQTINSCPNGLWATLHFKDQTQ